VLCAGLLPPHTALCAMALDSSHMQDANALHRGIWRRNRFFSSPGVHAWDAEPIRPDVSPFRGFLEESP